MNRFDRSDRSDRLPKLPIGVQTFERLREEGCLYVDKTRYLVNLIDNGYVYFLSRPRRFGKSLTVSTLAAMFSGKRELFKGLYAEEFFDRANYRAHPVIWLDMSRLTTDMGLDVLRSSMLDRLHDNARRLGVEIKSVSPADAFDQLMARTAEKYGLPAVVLIDEYDKPILDCLQDAGAIERVRGILRDFYTRIKASDAHVRFVFITGISKFSKMGVFSAMNNLKDISTKSEYAAMLGYTESELAANFGGYIGRTAAAMRKSEEEVIESMRDYYDGFSFDGQTRLYNPFSTLNFFDDAAFKNYWFESGTPSFLVQYVKQHDLEVENFRGLEVADDFTYVTEIEQAPPESFLFQSGYLTVRESDGRNFILDYPNKEVLSSVANLFLYGKMGISGFTAETNNLEKALSCGDADKLVETYDKLLTAIPYDIYDREESKYAASKASRGYKAYPLAESFYHALLFTLIWGARASTAAERHSYMGRSDIEAEKNGRYYVLELKVTAGKAASERAADSAIKQIHERGYADKYAGEDVTLIGIAVDSQARRVGAWRIVN